MKLQSHYIDPSNISIPELCDALAYWTEKRGKRIAPRWSDVSLMDFDTSLIPFINVTDFPEDLSNAKYRFWGTGLVDIFGEDFTNRGPKDFLSRIIEEKAQYGYEKLVKEKRPNCEAREFVRNLGFVGRQLVLRLPLSDDGDRITHGIIIHFHDVDGQKENVKKFFEKVFSEGPLKMDRPKE